MTEMWQGAAEQLTFELQIEHWRKILQIVLHQLVAGLQDHPWPGESNKQK